MISSKYMEKVALREVNFAQKRARTILVSSKQTSLTVETILQKVKRDVEFLVREWFSCFIDNSAKLRTLEKKHIFIKIYHHQANYFILNVERCCNPFISYQIHEKEKEPIQIVWCGKLFDRANRKRIFLRSFDKYLRISVKKNTEKKSSIKARL